MNKISGIVVCVIIIISTFCFIVYKTSKTSEDISIISESAIEYAQSIYKDMNFDMLSWNYNRPNHTYTVTLVNTENHAIQLYCIVEPEFQNGKYYYVKIMGGRNIDINKVRP